MTQDYRERLSASHLADHPAPREGPMVAMNLLVVVRPASLPPER